MAKARKDMNELERTLQGLVDSLKGIDRTLGSISSLLEHGRDVLKKGETVDRKTWDDFCLTVQATVNDLKAFTNEKPVK